MTTYSFNHLIKYWDNFSNLWGTFPFSYNKMKKFHKYEEKLILSKIKNKKSVILDLGCGIGRMLILLKKRGFKKLYGIDISSKMLNRCKKSMADSIVLLQYDFRNRLPFQSEQFDFVLSTANSVISGIEKPEKILKEVKRVLKNEGRLVIDTYNAENLTEDIIEKYYKKLPKKIGFKKFDKKKKIIYFNGLYSRWLTENELKNLIEKAGFKLVSIQKKGIGLIAIAKKE